MTISHIFLLLPRTQFSRLLTYYTKLLAPLTYDIDIGPIPTHNNLTGFATLLQPDARTLSNDKASSTSITAVADSSLPARDFPDFWLKASDEFTPTHIAFDAPTNASVREFYKAGVEAGGSGNGEPGIREFMSRQPYYAAFVIDEAGNNIEAVCLSGIEE